MKINWKDKKTWIIIGAALLVIVVVIIIIRRKKNEEKEEEEQQQEESNAAGKNEAAWPLKSVTFGYSTGNGSYGWQIKLIQKALNDINNAGLTVDGKFGPLTKAAVESAFPNLIEDGQISQAEFESMCDTFREAYAAKGTNYATNDELKLTVKKG